MSLAAFLHTWWLNAEEHQASYQQQDAHEFYLSALFGLGNSADSTSLFLCGCKQFANMYAPCDCLPKPASPAQIIHAHYALRIAMQRQC